MIYIQEHQIENQGYRCAIEGFPRTDIDGWAHISEETRCSWLKGWDQGNTEKNAGIAAAASVMGKKGGSAKSPRKKTSSAANGKKGGRPKKEKS